MDSFSALADRYLASEGNLRQTIRHALVARGLRVHLPAPPARVVDVGGGACQQAIPLARDEYSVTVLDTSSKMLAEARRRLVSEDEAVQGRVRLVEGDGFGAPELLGERTFDAALCHGVVMYQEDPRPMIQALAALVRPGGVVSVLAKNADALAMRSALEKRYGDALAVLRSDRDLGGMGVVTRGDTVEGLSKMFTGTGLTMEQWYGVRVFTDHLGARMPGPDLPEVLELEWEAVRREPYRSVARLIHILGRKA